MLDGCGIETAFLCARSKQRRERRDRCSMAVESRPAPPRLPRVDVGVAIDARWLWNRDRLALVNRHDQEDVAIDARWLWNRDSKLRRPGLCPESRSRSMLDGCGIETSLEAYWVTGRWWSRSMLDGCGIETKPRVGLGSCRVVRSRSMLDGCGIETTTS